MNGIGVAPLAAGYDSASRPRLVVTARSDGPAKKAGRLRGTGRTMKLWPRRTLVKRAKATASRTVRGVLPSESRVSVASSCAAAPPGLLALATPVAASPSLGEMGDAVEETVYDRMAFLDGHA